MQTAGENISPDKKLDAAPQRQRLNDIFGEEGTDALVQGIEIYRNSDKETAEPSQGERIEMYEKAAPLMETIIKNFIKILKEKHTSNSGLLKIDPINLHVEVEECLAQICPESFEKIENLPGNKFINYLGERIWGYIITLVAVNEGRYRRNMEEEKKAREATSKKILRLKELIKLVREGELLGRSRIETAKLREEKENLYKELAGKVKLDKNFVDETVVAYSTDWAFGELFFTAVDNPKLLTSKMTEEEESSTVWIEAVSALFTMMRKVLIPFFKKNEKEFQASGKGLLDLREDNAIIFERIKKEGTKKFNMCTADNKTLLSGKPMVVQIIPTTANQGRLFDNSCVNILYHEGAYGEEVKRNKKAQEHYVPKRQSNPVGGAEFFETTMALPGFFLDRADGRLKAFGFGPECLDLIDPTGKIIELIKQDMLFYYSNVTCKSGTLEKMWGDGLFSDRKKKAPVGEGGETSTKEKKHKEYTDRQYPYDGPTDPRGRARAILQALTGNGVVYISGGEEIKTDIPIQEGMVRALIKKKLRQVTEAGRKVSHKRLLYLIRKYENNGEGGVVEKIVGACHPSEEQKEKAARAGMKLNRGLELTGVKFIGTPEDFGVFHPEDLEDIFKEWGVNTLEEAVAKFPGKAFIRYETWVEPEENEEKGQECKAIIAHVRERIA